MKFAHTEAAAKAEKQSKWELIEAIAQDAVENDVPITGLDSCLATKRAIERVGEEKSDRTIEGYCLVAKFDHESTPRQRRIWRRYGTTVIVQVASAGWTQEAAFDLLAGEHKSVKQVLAAVAPIDRVQNVRSLDGRWAEWANRATSLLMDGAALADETGDPDLLDAHAALAFTIYQRLVERQLDAEIRALMDSAAAE